MADEKETKSPDLNRIDFGERKPPAESAEVKTVEEIRSGEQGIRPDIDRIIEETLREELAKNGETAEHQAESEPESEVVEETGCVLYFNHGEFEIPQEDVEELNQKIEKQVVQGFKKVGAFEKKKAALLTGYGVATEADYNSDTASYSTRTTLIEVNGRKYFVVYNYPGSDGHRKGDTGCRKAWGEKAFKATEEKWRETFIHRSLIPAVKGNNERVVILPFEKNISLVDILEKYDSGKFRREYEYGKRFDPLEYKTRLATEVAGALSDLHKKGRTLGEVIPANTGLTPDGEILFFDPETPYVESTPEVEQKARDLWSWCMSACCALNRSKHKFADYTSLINDILKAYGDPEVIAFLQQNLCYDLKLGKVMRHRIAYEQFKARLTLSSRKQHNEIVKAIRDFEIAK